MPLFFKMKNLGSQKSTRDAEREGTFKHGSVVVYVREHLCDTCRGFQRKRLHYTCEFQSGAIR